MSAIGAKRTLGRPARMTAFDPKRTTKHRDKQSDYLSCIQSAIMRPILAEGTYHVRHHAAQILSGLAARHRVQPPDSVPCGHAVCDLGISHQKPTPGAASGMAADAVHALAA